MAGHGGGKAAIEDVLKTMLHSLWMVSYTILNTVQTLYDKQHKTIKESVSFEFF